LLLSIDLLDYEHVTVDYFFTSLYDLDHIDSMIQPTTVVVVKQILACYKIKWHKIYTAHHFLFSKASIFHSYSAGVGSKELR